SDTCYVFDGAFPGWNIRVPIGVDCAKITVPSDSRLSGIIAHLPRTNTEVVNEGQLWKITARLPRPSLFALRGPSITAPHRRTSHQLPELRSRTPAPKATAAPSKSERAPCVPPPPTVSTTPPSRAGLFGYDRGHGERPGQSGDQRPWIPNHLRLLRHARGVGPWRRWLLLPA
ncbi:unnamed protein product, partial [Pelagomonas calceolata]